MDTRDLTDPWEILPAFSPWSECTAMIFDSELLLELSTSLSKFLASSAVSTSTSLIASTTVFAGLSAGLIWPLAMIQMASFVDNPFSIAMNRVGILV